MRKLLVLVSLLGAALADAATITKPEVTLELPDGWVEIPQDSLQQLYGEMKRRTPLADVSKYDYAFQASAGPPWLAYPYVLVKVRSTGRPTPEELESLPALAKQAGAPGPMRYDKAANIVWMPSQTTVEGVGEVGSLSAFIPTERGFLDVHGYAPIGDFPALSPVFEKVAASAIVAPELRYRQDADRAEGFGAKRTVFFVVIALLIVLGAGIFRRRRN